MKEVGNKQLSFLRTVRVKKTETKIREHKKKTEAANNELQRHIAFQWRAPKKIEAVPSATHDRLGRPRTTWYYTCKACEQGRNMHQSFAPRHLQAVHGCSKSEAKRICERSRKSYYRHRYDDDIKACTLRKHLKG